MEKKDYLNLQSKYSYLQDLQERYRKDLIDFIHEAFEKHNDEFKYKCKTHRSWEAMSEDENECFCAQDDLPVCLSVYDTDFHPTCIRLKRYDDERKIILVNGFNWTEDEWQKNRKVLETLPNLEAVADFMKEVLEQELQFL